MKEAGVTVGGFYKHFGSRDELVVEALATAFKDLDVWEEHTADIAVSYTHLFPAGMHSAERGTLFWPVFDIEAGESLFLG